MRKIVLQITVLLITLSVKAQFFHLDSIGLNYYNKGSELINLGDFTGADSLLTLALCSYKHQDVYYNRAVSRLLLADTSGYCLDLGIAANKYFDKQAAGLFNHDCCTRVDTFYYDRKRILSDKSEYRYYEILKYPRYDSVINGSFHDTKSNEPVASFDFGCNSNFLGLHTSTSDMIAGYVIEDTIKYYFKSNKPISIYNEKAYKDLKNRAKILFSKKYCEIKTENQKESLQVFFKVFFDTDGNVVKVQYIGFYPEIFYNGNIQELEKDLLDVAEHYPKVSPAKFFDANVYFMAYDSVEF
jgi:hypothetical protein